MSSRRPRAALLALAASASAACARGVDAPPPGAPDVLFVTLDALPPEHAGFLGARDSATPALDALAADALVLEGATAPPAPSALASWTSGVPSEVHGCDGPHATLDPRFTTLAERFLAAGYETACVVAERAATTLHGMTQGFVHADESLAFPEVDPALALPAQALADRAIRFVGQRAAAGSGPWLLWLHLPVPEDAVELRALDAHLGRVLERVRGPRTLVLVASAARAGAGEPRPAPLLVAGPGVAPGRAARPARAIDVLPTLLAAAGLPRADDVAGEDLLR